jgi:2-amino-4-hydroxy-6-hydroxymethyldihydropteridine diphosphokinase
MMHRVLVGLGSNVGDRLGFLQKAVDALANSTGLTLVAISSVYETEPVGVKEQPQFLNAALEFSSTLSAQEVYDRLKQIEQSIGRTPSGRWGPREIDLDLLYFDDTVLETATFIVPHRESSNRRFVLIPLTEIAGDFVDPARKRSLRALLEQCPDSCAVVKSSFQLHSSALEA